MVAYDYRPPIEQNVGRYMANIQRKLISETLSTRAQHLVAYDNAWRLIAGSAWS